MKQFPKCVPEVVIEHYRQFYGRRHGQSKTGNLLYQAMKSAKMERAWKAIARRKSKANPERFLILFERTCRRMEGMNSYPTRDQIKLIRRLSRKIRNLQKELESDAAEFLDRWWQDQSEEDCLTQFCVPPLEALEGFANWFELQIKSEENDRTSLTAYVGKPQAQDAKRVYVIRLLAEGVRHLYGQPLHDVVALTAAEILEQEIDIDLVRKLVKSHNKLKPPHYFSPEEWEEWLK